MSNAVDLKKKEEKDAELDRRIEALRKKNEALMRRYQEIEEDKKKAEQEGIAVTTPRKPRSHEPDSDRRKIEKENITVTVDLSKLSGEKRLVNDRKVPPHRSDQDVEEGELLHGESPPRKSGAVRLNRVAQRGGGLRSDRRELRSDKMEPRADRPPWEGGDVPAHGDRPRGGRRGGRGQGAQHGVSGSDRKSKEWEEKRRQNIEKMNEEMEKIAEYERGQRADGEKNPTRNFLDDPRRSGPIQDTDRKEGSRRHVRNWGGLDFDNVKTGTEVEKEWTNRRPGTKSSVDMTLSMTGRERAEYLRWKKEREQIDEERLARHRNSTGQWKREWDAQKTDTMFSEDSAAAGEATPEAGSRRARGRNARMQQRSGASEDSKRTPKVPTFGDFLGHGKSREEGRSSRGRGKGRGQGKSYSMHDNRWEADKEEEKGKKEEQEKEKKEKPREEPSKAPSEKPAGAMEKLPVSSTAEEDEDQWEDASDGEEVVEEEEEEEEEEEVRPEDKKAAVQKDSKPREKSSSEKISGSHAPSTPSPKQQRTPGPKVHIPSPKESLSTQDPAKPLSPFTPLEGHQPVSDWGEEMEMQSPKSSAGESPLKPSNDDSSLVPTKSQEDRGGGDASNQTEEACKQAPTQPDSLVELEEPVLLQPPDLPADPPTDPSSVTPATDEPSRPSAHDSTPHEEESMEEAVEPAPVQTGIETVADVTQECLDQPCSEDSKSAKVPTFGDFLGHRKSKKVAVQKDSEPSEKSFSEKSSGSSTPSTPSPKQQRTPGPKVHIPSPQESLSTPEPAKLLSTYTPLEGHQPVSDWGEEMEMQSPKSSMGESPLKPSNDDSSLVPTKSQEERRGGDASNQTEEACKQAPTQQVLDADSLVELEEPVLLQPPDLPADPSSVTPATDEPSRPSAHDSTPHEEESVEEAVEPAPVQTGIETVADVTQKCLDQPCSG
ncbi:coiled-coil domain-containing protein 9 isoform X2 [Brachyhypopomus gauderio]|uniref:coiled-coil domain-containing protein 9 isoform X2 n=1 Tax=Brachyhypopomus gauderio TaxID=698409 RepID=UPI00404353AE